MMNRIILSGVLMLTTALPVFAQEQPPVLDSGFGIKSFGINPEVNYGSDNFHGFEHMSNGGFYLAGYLTFTKLGDDGSKLWSIPYRSDSGAFTWSQGGLFTDAEDNAYVVTNTLWPQEVPAIVKYSAVGEQIKKQKLPINLGSYPLALSLTGSRADGRIYALAEYYGNSWERMVFIGCFDKELVFVSSSVFADPDWSGGGISADDAGNVYYAGATPEYKWLIKKYAPGLSAVEWEARPDEYSDGRWVPAAGATGLSAANGDYVLSVSSEGAEKWRIPMTLYDFTDGIDVDVAGNIYMGGSTGAPDYYAQLIKLRSADGIRMWSLPEQNGWWWVDKVLIDNQNRIYTVGHKEPVGDEYYYIARYLQGGDITAPAETLDLAVTSVSSNSITISWTAPGDDENGGTATGYDLRHTTAGAIMSDADFSNATQVPGVPAPKAAGSVEAFTVTGLIPGTTYFFALKTADEAGNTSGLSNSLKGITTAVPRDKYEIFGSSVPTIVVVNTYSSPLVSLVKIFGTTNPASGIGVDFTISTFPAGSEGQELTKSSETTVSGFADVVLKLGNIPAEYGVTATCDSCEASASSVTFTCCGKLPNDDFKQFDLAWATQPYNTQTALYTKNIRQKGCAVTSLATLLNYYADAFSELEISTTNPKKLNDTLVYKFKKKGYGFDDQHRLKFEVVSSTMVSNGKVIFNGRSDYSLPLAPSDVNILRALIDGDLNQKLPVVITVNRSVLVLNQTTGAQEVKTWVHFMLVVGRCANKYIVSDPGSGARSLLDPEESIVSDEQTENTFGPVVGVRRFKKK